MINRKRIIFFLKEQYIIGNKLTLSRKLFPEEIPKQMKNHFYSNL